MLQEATSLLPTPGASLGSLLTLDTWGWGSLLLGSVWSPDSPLASTNTEMIVKELLSYCKMVVKGLLLHKPRGDGEWWLVIVKKFSSICSSHLTPWWWGILFLHGRSGNLVSHVAFSDSARMGKLRCLITAQQGWSFSFSTCSLLIWAGVKPPFFLIVFG